MIRRSSACGPGQLALDILPKQGTKKPWKLYQNYALDIVTLRYGRVDDGVMEFGKAPAATTTAPKTIAA